MHTHATEPAEVLIRLRGGAANQVRQTVLAHTALNAHNTFEQPDNLVPEDDRAGRAWSRAQVRFATGVCQPVRHRARLRTTTHFRLEPEYGRQNRR